MGPMISDETLRSYAAATELLRDAGYQVFAPAWLRGFGPWERTPRTGIWHRCYTGSTSWAVEVRPQLQLDTSEGASGALQGFTWSARLLGTRCYPDERGFSETLAMAKDCADASLLLILEEARLTWEASRGA